MHIRELLAYFNEKYNEKEHYNIKSLTLAPKAKAAAHIRTNIKLL
jgi:hypothetical protein